MMPSVMPTGDPHFMSTQCWCGLNHMEQAWEQAQEWFKNVYSSIKEPEEKPFVFCPYCGRRLAIIYSMHDCGKSDMD